MRSVYAVELANRRRMKQKQRWIETTLEETSRRHACPYMLPHDEWQKDEKRKRPNEWDHITYDF